MAAARAQVVRWGNSLAVRIPKLVAEAAGLNEGDDLTLEVGSRGSVVVTAIDRPKTLEELVSRIGPDNLHKVEEWGAPAGAEIW